jgi:formylglycine-generating enzyme required for sulfatase activity
MRFFGSCSSVLCVLLVGCGGDTSTTGSETDTGSTDDEVGESGSSGSESDEGCPIGSEGCPCTAGGFCDGGLVCLSDLCVDPNSGTTTTDDTTDDTTTDDTTTDDTTTDDTTDTTTGDGDGDWDENYPSCANMPIDACGGDNCCATDEVPGGWFAMGRGAPSPCPGMPVDGDACGQTTATCQTNQTTWGCPQGAWLNLGGLDAGMGGDDELPEHATRVGYYGLDRYEVTVGRMRAFVEAYDKPALLTSLAGGLGEHPDIAGTDWQGGWDDELPDTANDLETSLLCDDSQTWTSMPGANETYPINCVSWYLAYAFCAWDEGRLATEAEWERAAIGGEENRLYPWGSTAPSDALANYSATDNSTNVDVFAKPAGAGRYGQEGIAGSIWEWVFDDHDPMWYSGAGNDCQDCANTDDVGARVMRGGDWQYNAPSLRGAERFPGSAGADWLGSGIRCARD